MPTIILADQCFPPLAPPEGAGGCMAIIRIEDGSLNKLVDYYLNLKNNKWLPRG